MDPDWYAQQNITGGENLFRLSCCNSFSVRFLLFVNHFLPQQTVSSLNKLICRIRRQRFLEEF